MNRNKPDKQQDEFSKKVKKIARELKLLLADIIANRPLTSEEKRKRALFIDNYLLKLGGTILAISCRDGILLISTNPRNERNIFRIFHRVGLLAVGDSTDYKNIHLKGLISVLRRWMNRSKADIDAREITNQLAELVRENFNYFKSKRGAGPYKTNFIVVELGFEPESDFISLVDFEGKKSSDRGIDKCNYAIIETPLVLSTLVKLKTVKLNGAKEKNSKKSNFKLEDKVKYIPQFRYPVSEILELLDDIIYSQEKIWGVKEAALFVGLLLFLFNDPENKFEMEYLDRKMLKKTSLGERRFHYIWKSITNPNPYKPSDPYQNWKKFVAPVRREIKKGKKYPPRFQMLFELLDVLQGKNKKEKEILAKIGKQEIEKLIRKILKGFKSKK